MLPALYERLIQQLEEADAASMLPLLARFGPGVLNELLGTDAAD